MSWKTTYEKWKNKKELNHTVAEELKVLEEDATALEEAFYKEIDFGTAGMRGLLGPGINRLNIYTVRHVTEGLARLMDEYGEGVKQRGVVIAYDGRHHSREFAEETAGVLALHGIKSTIFTGVRPTPELSFAVRNLHTFAGVMVTASHNTEEYNGYKVYGEDGGQMPPEDAARLTKLVEGVEHLEIPSMPFEEAKAKGFITEIDVEMDEKYLAELDKVTIDRDLIKEMADQLTFVYTPLQGTGQLLAEQAFDRAGFKHVVYVDEQKEPNPDFSNTASPNPENKEAFDLAIEYGKKANADVLLASDPDSDRMGVAVRMEDGEYQVITGNQIAALIAHYLLESKEKAGTLPNNGVMVKSIVSSEMPAIIGKTYGVETESVLTGFKFIAEKIKGYEATGNKTFLLGFEESYGYLIRPFVRDKDAIQTVVFFAEVVAYYKKQGKTPYDGLVDLYQKYGYFKEKTISVTLAGQSGAAEITRIMKKFREEVTTDIAGEAISSVIDYQSGEQKYADGHVDTFDMERSDVLKYFLEDETWIAIRPSGTEPKIKFYIGVKGNSEEEVDEKIATYEAALHAIVD